MSILIKGMEMPTSCYDCPFGVDVDICVGVAHGCNLIKDFAQFADERHTDCPLVPVPPHGRLIDASAIPYNKIMLEDDVFYYGVTKPYIDRMPTIIPAEEVE